MAFLDRGLFKLRFQLFADLGGDDLRSSVLLIEVLRDLRHYFAINLRYRHLVGFVEFEDLLQTQTQVINIIGGSNVVIARGLLFTLKTLFISSLIAE